jgi:hypothetical protein
LSRSFTVAEVRDSWQLFFASESKVDHGVFEMVIGTAREVSPGTFSGMPFSAAETTASATARTSSP